MASSSTATPSHSDAPSHLTAFHWEPQPAAQNLIDGLIEDFLAECPKAAKLAKRMKQETGTRFKDWIDTIFIPPNSGGASLKARLKEVGFEPTPVPGGTNNYTNPRGIFPAVVLETKGKTTRVAIKVDSVAEFLAIHEIPLTHEVQGEPGSQLRLACAFKEEQAELWVVERHGYRGLEVPAFDAAKIVAAHRHLDALCRRPRHVDSDAEGFASANALADAAIKDIGRDWACDLWFEAERRYWMRRNRAAQVQFARQQKLGLGWANHDHHTYRNSRENFTKVIALWEKLGLHCRESFYAGAEAGWGAQVMEHAVTGITIFNDVDMSPEELREDFAHKGFATPAGKDLGTIGLWVALHGESFLGAGMHHLECQFDWYALVDQLERDAHVRTMTPFTKFPYLRQAFTEGERWPVDSKRIDRLLKAGVISRHQAEEFREYGALGSHLENLERNDGFKGFNQQGVSDIISRTDPRKHTKVLQGA